MPTTFSVVIPTYNQADYLRVALKSVLDQTFTDFEVIIVNNSSTDHTLDVIQEMSDPRVQVINFRNNGVIGAGRNVGIKASKGAYVAFLDSDDTWYSNKLEKIAGVIETDSQVGLLCHNQDMVRDGRVELRTHYGPPTGYTGTMYYYILGAANGPSTSATIVARRYLDQVGHFSEDPAFITVEDYELWLRLARVCRFHFVEDVLGTHCFHDDSSSTNAERQLRAGLAVLEKLSQEPEGLLDPDSRKENAFRKRAIRYHCSNAYYIAGRNYQRKGAHRKTLACYFRTITIYPLHKKVYAGLALLVADLLLGHTRRKNLAKAAWGASWRWG